MIKTTTKRKRGKDVMAVKVEGDLSTIVLEVCHTLARGVEVIAEEAEDTQVESTLYATIRMAIMHLEKDGHIIDRNRLGHALMEDNNASTD